MGTENGCAGCQGKLSLRVSQQPPSKLNQKRFEAAVEVCGTCSKCEHRVLQKQLAVACELWVVGSTSSTEPQSYLRAPVEFTKFLQNGGPLPLESSGRASFSDLRLYRRNSSLTTYRLRKSEFVADAKLHNADFVLAFRLQHGGEASEPLSDWCFTQRFTVHHRTTALPGDDCTTHSKRARLASVPATSQFWFVLDDDSSSGHIKRFLDDGDRTEKSDSVSDAGSGTDLPCSSRSRASTPPLSPLISYPIWPSGKQDMKSSQAASTLVTDRQCSNFGMLPSIKELLGLHGKGFSADFSPALSRVDYFTNLHKPSVRY